MAARLMHINLNIQYELRVVFHNVSNWGTEDMIYSSKDFVDTFGLPWRLNVDVHNDDGLTVGWHLYLLRPQMKINPRCKLKIVHGPETSEAFNMEYHTLRNQTAVYLAHRYSLQELKQQWMHDDCLTVLLHIELTQLPKKYSSKRNLFGGFSSFEDMGSMHDFTLTAEDTRIPTMKHVLAAQSSVFAAMLQHPMKETEEAKVTISDYSAAVVRAFNHYCFTAEVSESLLVKEGIQLLQLADEYDVRGLREACALYLSDRIQTVQEAAEVLPLAHALDFKYLYCSAGKIIGKNAPY